MNARRLSPLLCLLVAGVLVGPAHADGRGQARGASPPSRGAEQAARPQRLAPPPRSGARNDALADSVRRVQSRTGGQVLSAERVPYDGRDINRVKVVDDRGRVRVYMDDPSTRLRQLSRPTRGNDD